MPTREWMTNDYYGAGWVANKVTERTTRTASHIADKPTAIVLYRAGTAQASQTVRIELSGGVSNAGNVAVANMQTYKRGVVLFGLPTFNVQIGDTFGYQGARFTVTGITTHSGEIQAHAERTQT